MSYSEAYPVRAAVQAAVHEMRERGVFPSKIVLPGPDFERLAFEHRVLLNEAPVRTPKLSLRVSTSAGYVTVECQ